MPRFLRAGYDGMMPKVSAFLLGFFLFLIPAAPTTIDVESQTGMQRERVYKLAKTLNFKKQPMVDYWKILILSPENWEDSILQTKVNTKTAYTNLFLHETFLNSSALPYMNDWDIRHLLGHEAGHLICNCASEDTANRIADSLMNKRD